MVKVRDRFALASALAMTMTTALVLLAPGPANAHPEPMPTLVNRYVTLAPSEARLGVQLTLLYGTLPGGELRREMDRDGDGTLSPRELAERRRLLLDRLKDPAEPLLRLLVDGRPATLDAILKIDLGGDNGTGAQALLVDLSAVVGLDPGEHRLEVALGPDLPRMGETEIMLDLANPWTLRATLDEGGRIVGAQPLIRYAGRRTTPSERRAGGFVIRSDGPLSTRAEGPGLVVPLALVGLATGLGIALTLIVRRMDRQRAKDSTPQSDGDDDNRAL